MHPYIYIWGTMFFGSFLYHAMEYTSFRGYQNIIKFLNQKLHQPKLIGDGGLSSFSKIQRDAKERNHKIYARDARLFKDCLEHDDPGDGINLQTITRMKQILRRTGLIQEIWIGPDLLGTTCVNGVFHFWNDTIIEDRLDSDVVVNRDIVAHRNAFKGRGACHVCKRMYH